MLQVIVLIGRALVLAGRGHHEVVLENVALRQQLRALKRTTARVRVRTRDRLFWVVLARVWRNWRTALVLVQPETVVRWHRDCLRRRWTRRSTRRHGGRPARIHGELGKLGIDISERTVSRLVRRRRRPPSQTWRTFLTNHAAILMSIDFFTVSTLTGRVLFVFVVLAHQRRRIVHFNITEHPTATWAAQQIIEACPDDTAPRWLLRDRDAIYGDAFRRRVAGMGIGEVVSSPASPWQNPYAERLIGSLRRECLDHVIVINAAQLRCVLTAYIDYYHRSRTHLGLGKDTPNVRAIEPVSAGHIVAIRQVGGLHHRYERRAA
jgi:transposase InsO family protein